MAVGPVVKSLIQRISHASPKDTRSRPCRRLFVNLYAAPLGNIFHKDKDTSTAHSSSASVNVTFNNTAQFPRQIKVGDKVKTLSSHKVTRMSIPAGTTVTVYSSMKTHNPGDVLVVVDAAHPDQVVSVD